MTTVIIDARQFRARMQKLGLLIESSEITKAAGLDVLAFVADNFRTEGRRGGSGWKELAPFTIAQRERQGYGPQHPILERTGKLRRSFIRGAPDNVFRTVGPAALDVGTVVGYASTHERGRMGPPRIPQRKMLPTREQAQTIAAKAIEALIKERTKAI